MALQMYHGVEAPSTSTCPLRHSLDCGGVVSAAIPDILDSELRTMFHGCLRVDSCRMRGTRSACVKM